MEALVLSPVASPICKKNRPHPDMTRAPEADLAELTRDGFDNHKADPAQRVMQQDPGSEASPFTFHPQNLDLYPNSIPRPAVAYNHEVAVALDKSLTTPELLNVLGMQTSLLKSSPLMGLATRIVQAIICCSTGAEAYPCPDTPGWDVRTTSLEMFPITSKVYPDYTPLYIPNDLSPKSSTALVSLIVPGGAAAYGWHFNDQTGRPSGYMPSYARFYHPGGALKVLAVYAKPAPYCEFGGRALSKTALLHLEGYYRSRWGNGYWDQAYKTIAAMGAVYADPMPTSLSLGSNCPVFQQSTTRNMQDIGRGTSQWIKINNPGQITGDHGCWSAPWCDDNPIPRTLELFVIKVLESLGNFRFTSATSLSWDWVQGLVQADWSVEGRPCSFNQYIFACLDRVATAPFEMDSSIRMRAKILAAQTRSHCLYDRYPDTARAPRTYARGSDGFRNIFGFVDESSTLTLPNFDLKHTAALIAGVQAPVVILPTDQQINRIRLRDWLGCYCLRFHIAHYIALTDNHIWPDDFRNGRFDHHALMKYLPEGLRNLVWVTNVRRGQIPASNWQLLEPIHFLRDCDKITAYYGYDVCGTVELAGSEDSKAIRLASPRTSYAAFDSALRRFWAKGGTITLNMESSLGFSAIVDQNNALAPFAISPYVYDESEERVVPVTIKFNTAEEVFRANQLVRPT